MARLVKLWAYQVTGHDDQGEWRIGPHPDFNRLVVRSTAFGAALRVFDSLPDARRLDRQQANS